MRAGISRVAAEVIILVLVATLALLIFSPVGNFVFGGLGKATTASGATQIEIVGIVPDNGEHIMVVYLKNLGPHDIPNMRQEPCPWVFVIKNSTGRYVVPCRDHIKMYSPVGHGDKVFNVGETWRFLLLEGYSQPTTSTFTIEVYGPEGIRAIRIYRP